MSAASRIELARIMADGLTVKDAAKQARLRVGYRGLRPTSASALADLLANGHDVGIAPSNTRRYDRLAGPADVRPKSR